MSWDHELLNTMQQMGGRSTAPGGIKLAVMTGPTSLQAAGLQLDADDLLFAAHLLQDVRVGTDRLLPALKAGDTVAVVQVSDSLFLVLERMVSA